MLALRRLQTPDRPVGYMVNANATLGGGCPVPPPPTSFLHTVGNGFAATVEYADNLTTLFGTKTESQVCRQSLVLTENY